jgi:hypothetical protein
MKKFFAVAAVAGMAVLTSCGNAEDLAKKMQDSINKADSMMREQMKADSIRMADSIAQEAAKAAEAAKADSAAAAAHADSVAKGLIKEKK